MRAWDLDVAVRSTERGIGGDTLQTWHKFGDTHTS